jgi:hypothetical protein
MNAMNLKKMVVVLVLVGVLAGFAQADKLDLQAKLSKEIKIQLKDVTIAEALEKIGEKAGLDIVLSDEAVWKLPQGGATRLRVMLQGPLAESLTEMLNAFFMRYTVGAEQITIYPRPELEHILGRPTTKQLELLKTIYTSPIELYFLDDVQRTINVALGEKVFISPIVVQAQMNDLLRQLVGKDKVYSWVFERGGRRDKVIKRLVKRTPEQEPNEPEPSEYDLPTPLTIVQLLSQVALEHKPTYTRWYLSGMDFPNQIPEIRMVSSTRFRQAKLDQMIDISMEDDAAVIIQRLANWTSMSLYWDKRDPDWPVGPISVDMQNIKLGQALRNIVSKVNGSISVDPQNSRIHIAGPMQEKRKTRTPKRPTPRRSPESGKVTRAGGDYVGKISIPMDGGEYYIEFMLRESDLTDELRKLRDEKMEQILGRPPEPKPTVTPPKPATRPRKPKPGATRR